MSKGLNIKQVQDDLQIANETAEEFGYGIDEAGHLVGEQYGPDGAIVATYSIGITITETNTAAAEEKSN